MKIVGNIICQNAAHEILRAIESIAPITEEIYVMDGGSTDGTVKILKRYEEAYNLKIFEHPYDSMDKQRNRLLEKTPKGSWVISIDQDEKLNHIAMMQLPDFLDRINPNIYINTDRKNPLTIAIRFINLIVDIKHHTPSWTGMVTEKIFYNDRDVHFKRWYHTHLVYDENGTENDLIPAPDEWAVIHFAYLDSKRVKDAKKDIKSGKRDYKPEEWDVTLRLKDDYPEALL